MSYSLIVILKLRYLDSNSEVQYRKIVIIVASTRIINED